MGELRGVAREVSVLFVDVDGTLLGTSKAVSPENLAALSACRAAGIRVVLASGRPPLALALLARYVPMEDLVVALNGGIVVNLRNGLVLAQGEMPLELVSDIISIAERTGAMPCLYTAVEWFVRIVDERAVMEVKRSGVKPRVTSDLRLVRGPVIKVLLIGERKVLRSAEEILRDSLGTVLQIAHSYPEYLEVTGKAVEKGAACEVVLHAFGLSWNEAMAIGDSTNDIAMVRNARVGVAMGNAQPEVISVARYMTTSSDHHGVAAAVRGLILGEAPACDLLTFIGQSDLK